MGIFDFFKSSEKKEKKKNYSGGDGSQQQIRREIYDIVNNESEIMENGSYDNYSDDFKEISYYDEFGKEFKMPKKEWLDKKLYPAIRKNWSNMEGLCLDFMRLMKMLRESWLCLGLIT